MNSQPAAAAHELGPSGLSRRDVMRAGGIGAAFAAFAAGMRPDTAEAATLSAPGPVWATPEQYGAVGDGVTDDTAAINAALAGNKYVHLAPKTYLITGPVLRPSGVNLVGGGGTSRGVEYAATVLLCGTSNAALQVVGGGGIVRGLMVEGANKAAACITVGGTDPSTYGAYPSFIDVTARNAAGDNWQIYRTQNGSMTHCNSIGGNRGIVLDFGAGGWLFDRVEVDSPITTGLACMNSDGGTTFPNTFTQCIFERRQTDGPIVDVTSASNQLFYHCTFSTQQVTATTPVVRVTSNGLCEFNSPVLSVQAGQVGIAVKGKATSTCPQVRITGGPSMSGYGTGAAYFLDTDSNAAVTLDGWVHNSFTGNAAYRTAASPDASIVQVQQTSRTVIRTAATDSVEKVSVRGEAYPRYWRDAQGMSWWGNGTDPGAQVSLGRAADGTLGLFGAFSVSGTTSIGGAAAVNGAVTAKSDVAVGGTLNVTGLTNLTGAVTTKTDTAVGGALTVTGPTNVTGAVTAKSDVAVGGALTVTGPTNVTGAVTTTTDTTVGGTLTVTKDVTAAANASVAGNLSVGGDLELKGAVHYTGDMKVGGALTTTTVATTGDVSVAGAMDVAEAMHVGGAIQADGTMQVAGGLAAKADVAVAGSLDVTGASTFAGPVTMADAITGGAALNVAGAITGGAALNVAGAITGGAALNVAGDITASGGMNVSGSLGIVGDVDVKGVLTTNSDVAARRHLTTSSKVSADILGNATLDAGQGDVFLVDLSVRSINRLVIINGVDTQRITLIFQQGSKQNSVSFPGAANRLIWHGGDNNRPNAPAANGVLVVTLIRLNGLWIEMSRSNTELAYSQPVQKDFIEPGTLKVGPGTLRWYNDTDRRLTLTGVRVSAGVAPSGSALVIDVNRNGNSIFADSSARPRISAGKNTAFVKNPRTRASVAPGEFVTVDVDAVGTKAPGGQLYVTLMFQ